MNAVKTKSGKRADPKDRLHVTFDMVSGMAFIAMGDHLASFPGRFKTQREANAVGYEAAAQLGWLDESNGAERVRLRGSDQS